MTTTSATESYNLSYDVFNTQHDAVVNKNYIDKINEGGRGPDGSTLLVHDERTDGSFSTARSAHGKEYYVGGFKSKEGPNGERLPTAQEYTFMVEDESQQEQDVLDTLKAQGLIPDWVTDLDQLGDKGIGVIENAVEMGVLRVDDNGMLVPGDNATGATKNQALQDRNYIETSDGELIEFDDISTTTGDDGSEYTVVGDANSSKFFVSKDGGPFTWVDSESFEGAGLNDMTAYAGNVANTFASGRLGVNDQNEVFIPDASATEPSPGSRTVTAADGGSITVAETSDDGTVVWGVDGSCYVDNGSGEFVHVNSAAYEAAFGENHASANDVAAKFASGQLDFDHKGQVIALDSNKNQLTANVYGGDDTLDGSVRKIDNGFFFYAAGSQDQVHIDTNSFAVANFRKPDSAAYTPSEVAAAFDDGRLAFDPATRSFSRTSAYANPTGTFTPTSGSSFTASSQDGTLYTAYREPDGKIYVQLGEQGVFEVTPQQLINEGLDPNASSQQIAQHYATKDPA